MLDDGRVGRVARRREGWEGGGWVRTWLKGRCLRRARPFGGEDEGSEWWGLFSWVRRGREETSALRT